MLSLVFSHARFVSGKLRDPIDTHCAWIPASAQPRTRVRREEKLSSRRFDANRIELDRGTLRGVSKPPDLPDVCRVRPQPKHSGGSQMQRLTNRRKSLAITLCLVFVLAFSALTYAGLATSPFTLKPLAGLGSCPLGAVTVTK